MQRAALSPNRFGRECRSFYASGGVGRPLAQALRHLEAVAVLACELIGPRDEARHATRVALDVLHPATRPGREPDPEDRADVGVGHGGEHALVEAFLRLDRLDE